MTIRKRVLLSISAVVLILLAFAAYRLLSRPDIKKIAAQSSQNLNTIDTYSYEADLNLSATLKASYSAELGFHIIMNTDVSESLNASHSLSTIDIAFGDIPYAVTTEQYNVTEEDHPVVYSCTNNVWSKEESTVFSKYDFSNLQRLLEMVVSDKAPITSYSVSETVNGKKAYLMNVTASGEILKNSIAFQTESLISSEMNSQDSIDWDNLSAEFGIYIYKDSLLPAMITISFPELADLIAENAFPDSAENGLENIELSELSNRITFSNYNQPLDLTVPESVIAAVDNDSSEDDALTEVLNYLGFLDNEGTETEYSELEPNSDGSYTITSTDTQVSKTIVVPDSVSAYISADTSSVFATNEDYSSSYVYFFTGNAYDSLDTIISSFSSMEPYEASGAEITNAPSVSTIKKEVDVTVITYTYVLKESGINKSSCYIVVPVDNDFLMLWIEKDQAALINDEEIEEAITNLFVLP